MPELPEVETARRLAEGAVVGKRIEKVAVPARRDRIVFAGVAPRAFARALAGRTVNAMHRKGKQLWMALDRRPWPTFHFGMTGSFRVYRDKGDRPTYWKVELLMHDGTRLAMRNPRRLGRIRLLDDPPTQPPISTLGFDPLDDMPTARVMRGLLEKRRAPIKGVLLDQGVFAGVGNWIADEVLYQAGIDPRRRACDLTAPQVRRVHARLRAIIRKAVDVDADKNRFPRTWLFHHRWGKNSQARTARGEPIEHLIVAGRTTAWVPAVQQ